MCSFVASSLFCSLRTYFDGYKVLVSIVSLPCFDRRALEDSSDVFATQHTMWMMTLIPQASDVDIASCWKPLVCLLEGRRVRVLTPLQHCVYCSYRASIGACLFICQSVKFRIPLIWILCNLVNILTLTCSSLYFLDSGITEFQFTDGSVKILFFFFFLLFLFDWQKS